MNRWFAAILACFACMLTGTLNADEPARIRILSYNIHHGAGVDGKLDLERIAGVISSVNPDIVALQEVDQNAKRSRSIDQPTELARLTEMNVVFGGNIELQGGAYGNAILSKSKITRHQNHQLPNIDNGEQRGVIESEIEIVPSKSQISFLATHFDHRRDDRERVASADAINELISKRPDHPALLAGDLNDVVDSPTLSRLKTKWKSANDSPLPTVPVGQPRRQIDFILFQPDNRWRVIETRVLDEAVASDHRAILSVLELLPKTEQ